MSNLSPDELYTQLCTILDLPNELIKIIFSCYCPVLFEPINAVQYHLMNCDKQKQKIQKMVLCDKSMKKIEKMNREITRLKKEGKDTKVIELHVNTITSKEIQERRKSIELANQKWDVKHQKKYPTIDDQMWNLEIGMHVFYNKAIIFDREDDGKTLDELDMSCQKCLDNLGLSNYAFRIGEY